MWQDYDYDYELSKRKRKSKRSKRAIQARDVVIVSETFVGLQLELPEFTRDSEEFPVSNVIHTTEKAVLLHVPFDEPTENGTVAVDVWIPKSVILNQTKTSVELPAWFLEDKSLLERATFQY